MNSSIEYISAGLILCLVLGFTSKYTSDMVDDRISMVQKNQGITKVEKILDMLVLTEGSPRDWDNYPANPDVLGLASTSSSKMYQLSREKVLRLSSDSSFYISATEVRNLIGLSTNYFLSIRIQPLLNVSIERLSMVDYRITAYNQWQSPVPNVEITALYNSNQTISSLSESDIQAFLNDNIEESNVFYAQTNSLGLATLNLSSISLPGCILVKAEELTSSCVSCWDLNATHISSVKSQYIVSEIESTMGSVSGYNTETVYRNVEIDDLNYLIRFTLWSGG